MADLWLTPDEVAELPARIRCPACIARLSSGVPAASGGVGRIMPGSPGGRLFGALHGCAVASSAGVEHGFDLRADGFRGGLGQPLATIHRKVADAAA